MNPSTCICFICSHRDIDSLFGFLIARLLTVKEALKGILRTLLKWSIVFGYFIWKYRHITVDCRRFFDTVRDKYSNLLAAFVENLDSALLVKVEMNIELEVTFRVSLWKLKY